MAKTTSQISLGDHIDGIVRTADGKLKIQLQFEDFPLTCQEGDVIDIRQFDNGKVKRHEMFLLRDDK